MTTDVALKVGVRLYLARRGVMERVRATLGDSEGEVGSWLILAAGLAAGAVAAVGVLSGWFEGKATEITQTK